MDEPYTPIKEHKVRNFFCNRWNHTTLAIPYQAPSRTAQFPFVNGAALTRDGGVEMMRSHTSKTRLLVSKMKVWYALAPDGSPKVPMKEKTDVQQGTLALMVLKTLDVIGSLHD